MTRMLGRNRRSGCGKGRCRRCQEGNKTRAFKRLEGRELAADILEVTGPGAARLALMASTSVEWRQFDYFSKPATAPDENELVWVREENDRAVTLGYFDGFTFRIWTGTDDCSITHWAPLEYPDAPGA